MFLIGACGHGKWMDTVVIIVINDNEWIAKGGTRRVVDNSDILLAESQSTKHHAGNLFDNDRYELDGSFFATKASVTPSFLQVDTKTQHDQKKLLRSVKVYYTNDKFVPHGFQTNGQVDWYWVKQPGDTSSATPIHQSTNLQGSRNTCSPPGVPKKLLTLQNFNNVKRVRGPEYYCICWMFKPLRHRARSPAQVHQGAIPHPGESDGHTRHQRDRDGVLRGALCTPAQGAILIWCPKFFWFTNILAVTLSVLAYRVIFWESTRAPLAGFAFNRNFARSWVSIFQSK